MVAGTGVKTALGVVLPRNVKVISNACMGAHRWMDDIFIERLWPSLKYECAYLHAFEITLICPKMTKRFDIAA